MERSRNIFILLFFIFIFMDSICNEVVSFRFLNHLFLLANHLLISMQGVESSPSCRAILVGGCSAKSAYEWLITKLPCPPSMDFNWKVIWKLPL